MMMGEGSPILGTLVFGLVEEDYCSRMSFEQAFACKVFQ